MLLSTNDTNIKYLETIQNNALRVAMGALSRTQLPSLNGESNVPPLRLFIKQRTLKTYYTFLTKGEDHPVYDYIQAAGALPANTNFSTKKKKPFILLAQDLARKWDTPPSPNLVPQKCPQIPPWEPLEKYIHTDLPNKLKKADGPDALRAVLQHNLHHL